MTLSHTEQLLRGQASAGEQCAHTDCTHAAAERTGEHRGTHQGAARAQRPGRPAAGWRPTLSSDRAVCCAAGAGSHGQWDGPAARSVQRANVHALRRQGGGGQEL